MKHVLKLMLIAMLASTVCAQETTFPQAFFWYNADNYNDSVKQFVDISNNNNHANSNTNFEGFRSILNFQSCIEIDTLTTFFSIDAPANIEKAITAFSVYKASGENEESIIWELQLDSLAKFEISTQNIHDFHKKTSYSDITTEVPVVNLYRFSWKKAEIDTNYFTLRILGNDTLKFKGKFAEIIFFNRMLNKIETSKVYTYLGIKYGININGLDYTNSEDTIIWSSKLNEEFANEVAGIGKDSLLGINQKQGCANGGESILTIYTGDLMNHNDSNTTVINELDFLIWSDNGKNLADISIDTLGIEYMQEVSERKWKMTVSGQTASNISTNIKLFMDFLGEGEVPLLIINKEADFNFPTDSTIVFFPNGTDSLGHYYFYDILWDTDGSGSDAFSFVIGEDLSSGNRTTENLGEETSNDDKTSDSIYIYPNPSEGKVNIDAIFQEKKDINIKVYDENMKLVKTLQQSGSNTYNLSFFIETKGFYMFHVEAGNEKYSQKVVIQ